jgi:hypothetical protein
MAKEKVKAKKADKESKSKKSGKTKGKELTPLEKARLARASGKTKAKKAKKKQVIFKAPEGFKPFFMRVSVLVDKDGIITDMKAIRVKGSITNENAKTIDMGLWDPDVLRRLAARYCAVAFVRNEAKRLPQGSAQLVMRVSANRETGALKVSIKDIKFKEGKDGKAKLLDKKDPKYRLLRKPARFLAGAFTKLKDFPSAAEVKALLKSQDEDDEEVLTKKSTGKKAKVEKTKAKGPKTEKKVKKKKADKAKAKTTKAKAKVKKSKK